MDASENSINIAKGHLDIYQKPESDQLKSRIDYILGSSDDYREKFPDRKFDIVTAMEVIEHVNQPMDFLSTLNQTLKDEGILFLSTINKNMLSYLTTIIGMRFPKIAAEKLFGIIPDGTHDWNKYIEYEYACNN